MEAGEQREGERRVRDLLVQPLLRRGLKRPAGLSLAAFDAMVDDLCARLAYMSADGLAALEEQCAANRAGKERDRFQIGPVILDWAAQIEPPCDSASPLIRAVFRAGIGRDALAEGHAPELLAELKRSRRWPSGFVLKQVRDAADQPRRELALIEAALARGEDVPRDKAAWRDRRRAVIRRCEYIAAMAGVEVRS